MNNTITKWKPELYNEKHSFVYHYGENLIRLLDPKENQRILDLGCGSGQLTFKISGLAKEVIGIDKSAEMISDAQSKFSNIEFQVADASNFKFNEKIGLSYGEISTEYYWNEDPIFIYSIEDSFGQIIDNLDGFIGFNYEKLERQLEARYYYNNDSLIEVKKIGEALFGEDYEIETRARFFNNALENMKIVKNKIE